MKTAIQFNSYDGMGGALKTTYRFGYVSFNENKEGKIECDGFFLVPKLFVKIKIEKISINDVGMSIKGINPDNYGKIDMILGNESSHIWKLAAREFQKERLLSIHTNTRKYFETTYGKIEDIEKIVDKELIKYQYVECEIQLKKLKKEKT